MSTTGCGGGCEADVAANDLTNAEIGEGIKTAFAKLVEMIGQPVSISIDGFTTFLGSASESSLAVERMLEFRKKQLELRAIECPHITASRVY